MANTMVRLWSNKVRVTVRVTITAAMTVKVQATVYGRTHSMGVRRPHIAWAHIAWGVARGGRVAHTTCQGSTHTTWGCLGHEILGDV